MPSPICQAMTETNYTLEAIKLALPLIGGGFVSAWLGHYAAVRQAYKDYRLKKLEELWTLVDANVYRKIAYEKEHLRGVIERLPTATQAMNNECNLQRYEERQAEIQKAEEIREAAGQSEMIISVYFPDLAPSYQEVWNPWSTREAAKAIKKPSAKEAESSLETAINEVCSALPTFLNRITDAAKEIRAEHILTPMFKAVDRHSYGCGCQRPDCHPGQH